MLFAAGLIAHAHAHSTANESGGVVARTRAFSSQYYLVRPDLRKCAAPLCGSYWISAVNQRLTSCADGSRKDACYVARIDLDPLDLNRLPDASLVLGRTRQVDFPNFGRLAVLVAQRAWRPATDQPARGTWFLVADSGIRCITHPCYSIRESLLNGSRTQLISGVDLDGLNARPEDKQSALADLSGEGLVVVGSNTVVPEAGPAGDGITLVATQFFLRVPGDRDSPVAGPGGYCDKAAECTVTVYRAPVGSRADCYCPLCPEPLNAISARLNQLGWERHCADFGYSVAREKGGALLCPQVKCIAPGPLACVKHRCVFQDRHP